MLSKLDAQEVQFLLEGCVFVEDVARRMGFKSPESLIRALRRAGYYDVAKMVDKKRGAHSQALEALDPGVRRANLEKSTIAYGWIPAHKVREIK